MKVIPFGGLKPCVHNIGELTFDYVTMKIIPFGGLKLSRPATRPPGPGWKVTRDTLRRMDPVAPDQLRPGHPGRNIHGRAQGGGISQGYSAIQHIIGTTWEQAPNMVLSPSPEERMVKGYIIKEVDIWIPLAGWMKAPLRSSSTHRQERFYGGPPANFE